MNTTAHEPELRAAVRDGITRTIGAIGLAGIALIHTIDAPSHFAAGVGGGDFYLGVMYVGLIASCLALAAALIAGGDRRVWAVSAGLTSAVLIGFVLSRTVGLPSDTGDIGNWGEPLGIASLFVEGSFLALCAGVLTLRPGEPERPADPARAAGRRPSLASRWRRAGWARARSPASR